jgi:hypothetical protein
VGEVVPGCAVKYMEGGGPDQRCYKVNCDKLTRHIPAFKIEWTVRKGVEELYASYVQNGLTKEMFANYVRLPRIQALLRDGRVDAMLRPRAAAVTA